VWFVWIVLGTIAFIAWFLVTSLRLCPSCGVELPAKFGAPWELADSCPRCGWHRS
jgi:hypothetical protein